MANLHYRYFYYLSHFFYGVSYYIVGPYVPYLAQQSGQPEEEYFPLIVARAIGFLSGPLLKMTIFSTFVDLHKGIFLGLFVTGVNIYVMTITFNIMVLVASSFLMALSISMLDIFINTSILTQTQHNIGRSIIISHGFLMTGASVSSLLLSIWAGASLQLLGILCLSFSFVFLCLEYLEPESLEQKSAKGLPSKLLLKMCGLMFIFASIEHSFQTWFSPFAVMMGYLSKETAAFVVAIMTLLRIYTLFVKVGAIKYTEISSIGNVFVFLSGIGAFALGWEVYLVYVAPLLFALANSVLYSFYYSLPAEYGLKIGLADSSKFILWYSLGEIVLVSITGYLMAYTHPMALFVFMLLLAIINRMLLTSFTREAQALEQGPRNNRSAIEPRENRLIELQER